MKEETIFHIKVDYEEAIQAKKEILSSERDFINILKIMRRYHLLRQKELDNKLKINNKIRDLKVNLRRIDEFLPKIKIPEILKKKGITEKEEIKEEKQVKKEIKIPQTKNEDELEKQLREIQERLSRLG